MNDKALTLSRFHRPLIHSGLFLVVCLVVIVLVCGRFSLVLGQDEEQEQQKSEELKRLEALKAEAAAREAIAKSKKAELEARFPQSSSTVLDGKSTVADKLIEEQIGGYLSVAEAANRIGNVLLKSKLDVIAIYSANDIQMMVIYNAATKRIDTYKYRFDRQTESQELALRSYPFWPAPSGNCNTVIAAGAPRGLGGAAFNPLGIATSFLGSFKDILAFFRTDVEIKGSTFNVDESVLVAEVFRSLRGRNSEIRLYYPSQFPAGFDPGRDSILLQKLEALIDARTSANNSSAEIDRLVAIKIEQKAFLAKCKQAATEEMAPLQQAIQAQQEVVDKSTLEFNSKTNPKEIKVAKEALDTQLKILEELSKRHKPQLDYLNASIQSHDNDIKRLDADIAGLRAAQKPLIALNSQADLLAQDLVKVDEKTGINLLSAFLRSEQLQEVMNQSGKKTGWLKLDVVIAGGNTRIKRNLIVDVFNGGNRIWYNGGSVIEYHLFDKTGRSLLSDTTNTYLPYRKPKEIRGIVNGSSTDLDEQP